MGSNSRNTRATMAPNKIKPEQQSSNSKHTGATMAPNKIKPEQHGL